jgi:hypothetical protein
MLARNHLTKRPVRQAVKITRDALNHALDVAEPRLEKAAGDLEAFSRDALKSLRDTSLSRLDDLSSSRLGKNLKKLRKNIPGQRRHRGRNVALVAAGLAVCAFFFLRSA